MDGMNLFGLIATTVGILFAGNIYFVKRLVEKLENTSVEQGKQNATLGKIQTDLNGIGSSLREVKSEIKDLRRVEIEIAVLKSHFSMTPNEG